MVDYRETITKHLYIIRGIVHSFCIIESWPQTKDQRITFKKLKFIQPYTIILIANTYQIRKYCKGWVMSTSRIIRCKR